MAYYDSVIATVHFRGFRQFFRPDSAIATNQNGWKRNVWFDTEPQVEALSVDGISQMHFIETSEPPNPPGPDIDAKFPAPLAQIQAKTGFIIHWTSVPWDYLSSDPDVFIPDKILNCVGKLNETPFIDPLNWVKGTLYMRPPRFNVKPYPVPSTDPARPLFGVDLEIPVDFFDPINGATGSTYAGYDLLPFRGDGKYYAAKRENGIDGILPYADFNKIFENVEE